MRSYRLKRAILFSTFPVGDSNLFTQFSPCSDVFVAKDSIIFHDITFWVYAQTFSESESTVITTMTTNVASEYIITNLTQHPGR